jgi:hypothetical protein
MGVRHYTAAINDPSIIDPEKAVILLNRAICHLATEKYGPALVDLLTIENMMNTHGSADTPRVTLTPAQRIKLSHRKLQAGYKLRLYGKCQTYLTECENVGVDPAQIKLYREKLKLRLAEQKGEYNWARHVLDSKGQWGEVDAADYHGPVALKHSKTKGRYLVVTEDVIAGTVLIVEKAGFSGITTPGIIVQNPMVGTPLGKALRASANISCQGVHDLIADPSRTFIAEGLYPGNIRDTPHASESKRYEIIKKGLEGVGRVQIDDLNVKTHMNSFGGAQDPNATELETVTKVFGMCSMINHSCLENVVNGSHGDVSTPSGEERIYTDIKSTRYTPLPLDTT